MLRRLLFAAWLCLTNSLAIAEDVVSMAIGVHGVREIVDIPQWQFDLDVSPKQLQQLEEMFADRGLRDQLPELDGFTALHPLSARDPALVRRADEIYSPVYSKILEPEQLNQRRLLYLKSRFVYPLDVFNSQLFTQIGLQTDEYRKLEPEWLVKASSAVEQVDELRRKHIAKLLELSPDSRDRFVDGFGVKLLPKSITADRDVSVTSMGIVDSDRPERLLNEALIIVLPEPNTVTKAQRAELNRLKGEIRKIRAKDSTFNTAKMAMDGVSAILKDSQRAELIKNNHLHELRTNLNVLSSKRVLAYLQVKEDVAEEFVKICDAGQKEVASVRMKIEKDCLATVIDSLPRKPKEMVKKLLAGVWADTP